MAAAQRANSGLPLATPPAAQRRGKFKSKSLHIGRAREAMIALLPVAWEKLAAYSPSWSSVAQHAAARENHARSASRPVGRQKSESSRHHYVAFSRFIRLAARRTLPMLRRGRCARRAPMMPLDWDISS